MPALSCLNPATSPLQSELLAHFGGQFMITRAQFRAFMQLSPSTDHHLFKSGAYPKHVKLATGAVRISVAALAEWIENGGCQPVVKKRGRPVGSRNKNTDNDFWQEQAEDFFETLNS